MKFQQSALSLLYPGYLFGSHLPDDSDTDLDKEDLLLCRRWHEVEGAKIIEKLAKRQNTGQCPGGTNADGWPDYWDSV